MATDQGLSIVFAGTPAFAAHHLQALLNSHHTVCAVYTQPDRPAGRGKKLQASPVKELAVAAGIEVQQPLTLKDADTQAILARYNADVMVVVAYGLLLPAAVLETPRLGCINVHASLLPRWRGAAPIQRCIEAGDAETGVTIMQMDVGLDTGDMLVIRRCDIQPTDNADTLHDRLAEMGPDALLEALQQLQTGSAKPLKQDDSQATYAKKLFKEEALIDWSEPADRLSLKIRAFNPYPIAHTLLAGESLRIFDGQIAAETHSQKTPGTILTASDALVVACGNGTCLRIHTVQLPGKKAMSVRDLLNGSPQKLPVGTVLGTP